LTRAAAALKFPILMSSEHPTQNSPAVTLDGHSGSGKSTLARELARALSWVYLDSGAWYRGLTWAVVDSALDPRNSAAVLTALSQLHFEGLADGQLAIDGRTLGDEIRTPEIDQAVSEVADHSTVRHALTERMRGVRTQAGAAGVVADGRDAGSIIFPDACLKVFVQTSLEVRAQRRFAQQQAAGMQTTYETVLSALSDRDHRDSLRGEAAPTLHEGDQVLVNDNLSVEEAIQRLLGWTRAHCAV